jgi:hypothetical protein
MLLNADYFGKSRNLQNPFPGTFANYKMGIQEIKVWPINKGFVNFR